jgi:hypothetical protein
MTEEIVADGRSIPVEAKLAYCVVMMAGSEVSNLYKGGAEKVIPSANNLPCHALKGLT